MKSKCRGSGVYKLTSSDWLSLVCLITEQVMAQSKLLNTSVPASPVDLTEIKNLTCRFALKSKLLVLNLLRLEKTNSSLETKHTIE